MVIVLKKNITKEDRQNLESFLTEKNFKTNEIHGEEKTVIAAVGRANILPEDVELLSGVETVIPISKPYKLASREFKPENTIVEIENNASQKIRIGGQRIISIAGPCAVESKEQISSIAKSVSESGAAILRGGTFKPRTSPYGFQGLGEEGVKLLKQAGDAFSLPVVTEALSEEQLSILQKYGVDVIMIGARNMQNFTLLKEAGKLKKPVILKRSYTATIEEFLMSAEYLLSAGTEQVILCERGIRTFEKATKNTLDLSAIPVLRSMTHLPIIVDPSHAVGIRDKVSPMALASVAAGADGIIVEVHDNPHKALIDGLQALIPEMYDKLMHDIEALSPVLGKSVVHIRQTKPLNESKNQQVQKKSDEKIICAYSGKKGAYAEQAINRYFENEAQTMALDSFREVFKAVVDGKAHYGMIPIENSLAGSVYDNYDNLSQFEDVSIVGAVHLRIQHALLAPKGTTLSSIKRVYSHPQGFAQCSKLLSKYKWEKIATVSTANGAKLVADSASKENAAIASAITAQYYGLSVIQDEVEDDPRDYTRFVIIKANHLSTLPEEKNPNRASFMFCVQNETGALYSCLGIFQKYNMNLTRLESRPIAGQPWHYWFYADAELTDYSLQNKAYVEKIMTELKNNAQEVRLLGVYSEAKWGK